MLSAVTDWQEGHNRPTETLGSVTPRRYPRVMRNWILPLGLALSVVACQSDTPPPSAEPEAETAPPSGTPIATLETDYGEIRLRLLPEVAPETVASFIELAEVGFYKRTTFHRVLPGKMIQGGDPNSRDNDPYNDGKGGSGQRLKAEFSDLPMARGTVAMARQADDPDSASSQFFIVLRRATEWDGDYTVFAEVEEGLDIVDKISQTPRSKQPQLGDHPAGKILIKDVRIEYREVDPTG